MKRSTTPLARSPLARGKGLQRTAGLKPGGALPAESAKRQASRPVRALVREAVLERDVRRCRAADLVPDVACRGRLDVHEVWSRARHPGSHLHAEAAITVCRRHHTWLDDHPDEAVALGLLVHSWEPRPYGPEPADP